MVVEKAGATHRVIGFKCGHHVRRNGGRFEIHGPKPYDTAQRRDANVLRMTVWCAGDGLPRGSTPT